MAALFQFKQFALAQDQCAMKVGTDAVLLGAWANFDGCEHLLDVGAGTGILSLMCAQRFPELQISAVELDPKAAQQAAQNFERSKWANRLEVYEKDLQDVEGAYDGFISNPPYFPYHNPTSQQGRDNARQQSTISLDVLFGCCARMAASNAKMAVVYPFDQRAELLLAAWRKGWYKQEELVVHPSPGQMPKRVLVAFARRPARPQASSSMIVRNSDGGYHEDYTTMTAAFHIDL